ncbi:MAG: hypothetical protein LC667_17155 [Thioalkalivibrio sp.]|nr:hypothetical protein [Thioalkalivibrio sp.]
MGCRAHTALALLVVLATGACTRPANELRAGETVPDKWLATDGAAGAALAETKLVWVFRTADCLTCQSFDYAVRRLQSTYGDSLPFFAVHVGEPAREQVPRSFFLARRIRVARTVTLSPRQFSRYYRDTGLPALLVVRGSTVVWSSSLPSGVVNASQLDSLVQDVGQQVSGPGARNDTATAADGEG